MTSTIPITSTGTAVIATVEALTTEFVAPSTCYSMQLTQLSSPGYAIWLNEPQPVPGTKYPDCYPTEWMDGYTSIYNASSSIAPMMSPLVAPENWSTVKEMDNGYIALCPSGFQIHMPDSPVDSNRPAYGATCYSNFVAGNTVVVSGFDSQGYTGTVTFVPSSTDQCYAHVIEGKKATVTASTSSSSGTGAITPAPTQTSSSDSSTSSSSASSSNSVSGGAIAGAVIGAFAGLVLIILAIFFLFRRRRAQRAAAEGHKTYTPEMGAAYHDESSSHHNNAAYNTNSTTVADKALPDVPANEAVAVSPGSEHHHDPNLPPGYPSYAELDGNHAVELDSQPNARELDSGYHGSELQSAGQNHGFKNQ